MSRDFLPFFATHQGLKGLFFIWFSPGVPYDSWSSNPLEFLQYLYYLQIYWIFLIFSFLTVNSYLMEKIVNFYRTYRYLVFAPWTQTRWNFYDIFFSTESWDAQLACCIYFTSIRLKLTGSRAAKLDKNLKDVKGPVSPSWVVRQRPRMNRQKRFRELFRFREDIQSQSSKIACPHSEWLRGHTIFSVYTEVFKFLNYCFRY